MMTEPVEGSRLGSTASRPHARLRRQGYLADLPHHGGVRGGLRDPLAGEGGRDLRVREVAAGHGYDWRSCNALGVPTQRTRPDGTPAPPLGKIDWLLCRGLAASDPATVPAIDAHGVAISDHEVLNVSLAAS